MSVRITMPALSPTMEEGTLSKWLVKVGDSVSAGDIIAEIETDKATMEVEAVDEGVVAHILVEEGSEGVKINAVIAVLAEDGEDAASVSIPATTDIAADTSAGSADLQPGSPSPMAESAPSQVGAIASTPPPTRSQEDAEASQPGSNRVFASPLARRIAKQNGVEINAVTGTGPRGRIVKSDVENVQSTASIAPVASATSAAPAQSVPSFDFAEDGVSERKPHDGMRKVIAQRLTASSQTIPVYFVTMECELDALMTLRVQLNSAAPIGDDDKPAYKISVNDFVVKAMAMALNAVPQSNVSWTDTDRIYHKHADVGVAVAVDDGLFTPIVRQAELKTLSTISGEIKDMAGRAKNRKLLPEEYSGGCTAVSNLGMFGVKEFTSIINPPHASIVSIGAGEKRPVVKGDALAIATIMSATFAFDHRAIDGALGAELAASFKHHIENPMVMLV